MARGKPIGPLIRFTDAVATEIGERLSNGESLRTICADDNMPRQATVFRWLADERYSGFREQYTRAREAQADAIFDEFLYFADDGSNDWMVMRNADGENIGWTENGEVLRRSVLRVEARKWMAGKLRPKKYGEKLELEHTGEVKTTIDASALANLTAEQREQLRSITQALAAKPAGDTEGS
jgi:hypothetical protein